jgi:hemerythrin-like domain-containing protein
MTDSPNPYADTRGMYHVHALFRREFALLPEVVRGVAEGDKERAQVVADHFTLISLLLHLHHSGEDAELWPRLLTRAPKEVDPVIHLVEGGHAGIDALTSEIEVLLSAWRNSAGADDRDELADALQRLVGALYEHMGLEERLVLPLIERHIFASEWEKMVADEAAEVPPGAGPVLVGMLMYEGGIDSVPPAIPAVLAEAAPRAYAAYAEKVHGTATPPRSAALVLGSPSISIQPA